MSLNERETKNTNVYIILFTYLLLDGTIFFFVLICASDLFRFMIFIVHDLCHEKEVLPEKRFSSKPSFSISSSRDP